MDGMYSNYSIKSVLRDGNDRVIRIGPGLSDAEYGEHMGKIFDFLYDAVGEMRNNPEEPANGYLRLAMDCAITELKEINDSYMEHPNPHIVKWTRHIQQFDNCERVVDYITALAGTVCDDKYEGRETAQMNRQMKDSLLEASVPVDEIMDQTPQNPPIRIYEYDPRSGRLFKGTGETEAA